MKLILTRELFSDVSTIGKLRIVDSDIWFYTLEDKDRGPYQDLPMHIAGAKVDGQTAIPYGDYDVIINASKRFKKLMPLLLDVPGFEGVRIHNGNTAEHTHGCILLGKLAGENFVGKSVQAMNEFFPILHGALSREKCHIEIIKHPSGLFA